MQKDTKTSVNLKGINMKKHSVLKKYHIYLLLIFLCTISCGKENKASTEEIATDTTAVSVDTAAVTTDPIETTKDTVALPSPTTVDNTKSSEIEFDTKMGKVAFFCENENMKEGQIFEMKEERSYEMIAMLNPIIENDDIKTEILKVINESRTEKNQEPLTKKNISTRNIILGNYLSIKIIDPNDKFIIKLVSSDENSYIKKIYDDVANKYIDENFEWRWNVTPKPNSKGKTKLELVISPLNINKEIIKEKIKTYDININFKQNFIASVWDKMNRNIEWAIASIIAPVLIFLVGRFTKKKDKEDI